MWKLSLLVVGLRSTLNAVLLIVLLTQNFSFITVMTPSFQHNEMPIIVLMLSTIRDTSIDMNHDWIDKVIFESDCLNTNIVYINDPTCWKDSSLLVSLTKIEIQEIVKMFEA